MNYRITPAGAGKTASIYSKAESYWDHPRRCGENLPIEYNAVPVIGSPPQVRGKLSGVNGINDNYWITPAGAGKTYLRYYLTFYDKDHPRRCGENAAMDVNVLAAAGSPPQVRGKPVSSETVFKRRRITPAGAGKTLKYDGEFIIYQDHPRRCGENLEYVGNVCSETGSPPQVRGKPV